MTKKPAKVSSSKPSNLFSKCRSAFQPSKFVICIGIVAIILACLFRFVILNKAGTVNIISSSTLTKAINISELSTAEFRYKGIAEIYSDEEKTKLQCRVCYNAIVKAGINMNDVGFNVDTNSKTVTASLPEIDIKVTIVDEQSVTVLPSNADVGIDRMLKFSREDAENEAKDSQELIDTAQENLKATIEGLLYPILKSQGYSLIWG